MSKKKKSPNPLLIGNAISGDSLTKDQKKAYALVHDWIHSKKSKSEQVLRIGGMAGTGKAQPADTMIPYEYGHIRMGELKPGDRVFNRYGNYTTILGVYPQGVQPTYEVTFSNGTSTSCNMEHLWVVSRIGSDVELVLTLREILENIESYYIRMPVINRTYMSFTTTNDTMLVDKPRLTLYVEGFNYETITQVRYVGEKEQACIYVDDPEHIYLTEHYIPTHNTTLLKYIIESEKLDMQNCMAVSYTGQAVNVLRQSGVMAKTIHSEFMKSYDEPLYIDGNMIKRHGIPVMITKWKPVKSISSKIKLVIIDESSFLSESLEKQLKSYNVPILELGDPLQLPPVAGKQCFQMENLDYFLTQIMRQNTDNEIFRFIMQILNGDAIDFNSYGRNVKFLYAHQDIESTFHRFRPFYKNADMIITSTNKQRQDITDLYRSVIIGATTPYPKKGERLICRKNDWNLTLGPYPLTNGTVGTVRHTVSRSMIDSSNGIYYVDFQPNFVDDDYFDNLMCDSSYLLEPFGKDKYNSHIIRPGQKLEYAHAITVHSSQGSQADRVLYMDTWKNGYLTDESLMRMRYTAASRAKKTLYYMIPYCRSHPTWSDLRVARSI